MLKNIAELDNVPPKLQKILLDKVFHLAEVSNYGENDRRQYEESLKEYRDDYNTIETAEKKARVEERQKRTIEIVEKAIQEGFDNQVIQKLTGLSIDEIEEIRK